MNYGLYLSASGVLANMYRQDVFANNLANVDTVGFKRDLAMVSQRDPESAASFAGADVSNQLLDQLGGGVFAGPQQVVLSQGPLQETHGNLDVALTNPNQFFAVEAPRGQAGVRLTRDGRFTRNAQGFLVTNDGNKVLDPQDKPIQIPAQGKVRIGDDGSITLDGQSVARIQVTSVPGGSAPRLYKQGGSLMGWTGSSDPRQKVDAVAVKSGFVEGSSVDPVDAMMNIMDVSKSIEYSANMIKYHDMIATDAVNTLGRLA